MRSSGPLAGLRHFVEGEAARIGRNPDSEVVIRGPDASIVSGQHAEIRNEHGAFSIRDLGSTNGTFVNGRRIAGETPLRAPATIQLGQGGPELLFTFEEGTNESNLDRTLVVGPGAPEPQLDGAPEASPNEAVLREAIARARIARSGGAHGQTMTIMRDALEAALSRTRRRYKQAIVVLGALLLCVSAYGFWRTHQLKESKAAIDAQIRGIEARIARVSADSAEADQLIDTLDRYQDEARSLQQNVFYRLGVWERDEFVRREIRVLLREFGAEEYSVPPEFLEQVNRYIKQYQGPDRPNMERALGEARPALERMRRVLEDANLPPDLAYMVLVESAFDVHGRSPAGSAGLWQFTPETARQYGLRVGGGVDERFDTVKSTRAATKYMRELILDFGAGSSVMLAMAAYNVGPNRVKGAIRALVQEPIKQRNFWYLYRRRALPLETREYVPKVIAAMIIGRHPERFGF